MIPSALRLGWRNLGRNRKRTALAVAAVALAQTVLLVWDGLFTGYMNFMVDAITSSLVGHVHASKPGWLDDRALEKSIPDSAAVLAAIRADPAVKDAVARLAGPALVAAGEDGEGGMVVGLDLVAETGPGGLLVGLAPAALPKAGEALVGKYLADGLSARPGTELAVVGQAADGSFATALFKVVGIADTGSDLVNRYGVVVSLADAQELFALPGAAHEILVHAHRPSDSAAVAARLAALPALAGVEVREWRAVVPELASIVDLVATYELFMLFLVFIAAASGVANTQMMATFERTRELGMLLALGAKPGRIVRMVLTEAVVLGLVGAAAGTVIGVALTAWWSHTGVDLSALAGRKDAEISFAGMRWTMRIFPAVEWNGALQGFIAVFCTSILASLWPAGRAARLQPVEAMRS